MLKKRKRSAWTALSPPLNTQFNASETTRSDSPSAAHFAPPTAPPLHSNTPLIVPTANIRRMQAALGLTPEPPTTQPLVFLHPSAERTARAILAESRPSPSPPPSKNVRTHRRLSAASAVTPLHSNPSDTAPPVNRSSPNPPPPQLPDAQPSPAAHPSPITPHNPPTARALFAAPTSPNPAPPAIPPGASLFTTASGKPLALPPPSAGRPVPNLNLPPPPVQPILFTTASGKPLPPPPPSSKSTSNIASLFTTASGKPVPVPPPSLQHPQQHKSSLAQPPPFTTPRPVNKTPRPTASRTSPLPAPNLAPFTTPSPLARPRASNIPPSSASNYKSSNPPSIPNTAKQSSSSSLFLSSNQVSLQRPPNSTFETRSRTRSNTRSHPSPHTPSIPIAHLRKALFPESARNSSAKKPHLLLETPPSTTNNRRRRRANRASSSTTRTTPFKRPRRLQRPSPVNTTPATAQINVPQFALPAYLKNGLMTCTNPDDHSCPAAHNQHQSYHSSLTSKLQSPSCLHHCQEHIFHKPHFGHISCLPPHITKAFNFAQLDKCDVSDFVQWISTMFPGFENKPASCVGSTAWARMVYALAVHKLTTLQASTNTETSFCVANVIREFLRRLSVEWHHNKQPHLLRIMRNDSSPASHTILRIVGIEPSPLAADHIVLVVTDGWYIARCTMDELVQKRVWRGTLRVSDKISVSGSALQALPSTKRFFFGEADELGASMLRISANGLHKAPQHLRLGIRKPAITSSFKHILDNHGACPPIQVVLLRSYPVFYMEIIRTEQEEEKNEVICRREEGEDEARSAYEENVRREMVATAEEQKKRGEPIDVSATEFGERSVTCVKDLLVCGLEDDPNDTVTRKLIRIYNASDIVQTMLTKEGQAFCMTQVWPRTGIWTCKPEAVHELREQAATAASVLSQFPRKICSVTELQNEHVQRGEDFDGVYSVLHVAPNESNESTRFVYMIDDPGDDIKVLALELSDHDAACLPRALRFRGGLRPRFPLVAVQDAQFRAVSEKHDLVHAKAILRTSIYSARTIRRHRKRASSLKSRCEKVESRLRGKEEQLEILREAVISFVAGNINRIGAYFTSTQDM